MGTFFYSANDWPNFALQPAWGVCTWEPLASGPTKLQIGSIPERIVKRDSGSATFTVTILRILCSILTIYNIIGEWHSGKFGIRFGQTLHIESMRSPSVNLELSAFLWLPRLTEMTGTALPVERKWGLWTMTSKGSFVTAMVMTIIRGGGEDIESTASFNVG